MTGQITGGQGDHSALACSEHCPQPGLDSPQPLIQEAPLLKTELASVLGGPCSLTAETARRLLRPPRVQADSTITLDTFFNPRPHLSLQSLLLQKKIF